MGGCYFRNFNKWILLILVVIIVVFFIILRPLFKEPDFHKTSGDYKVGTHLFETVDSGRSETLSPGNAGDRRLAIRTFYPVDSGVSGDLLSVMDSRISKAFSKMYHIPSGSSEPSFSNSFMDVQVSTDGPFPVIIFSHGGFSYSTQNLSTMEELASHGYIVFAVSHTYEAIVSIFPGDEAIPLADPTFMQESMKMSKEQVQAYKVQIALLTGGASGKKKEQTLRELGQSFYQTLEPYLEVRLGDLRYFINHLKILNSDMEFPLSGKMDLDRIGMFGHSFGGIATSYICSDENTPVKAGINLDAPVILFNKTQLQLKRPFAFFYSTETALPKGGKIDMTDCNSYFAETSREDVFSLSFAGTAHYNFSDFNFMPPFFRFTPMLGSIDGSRMSIIMKRSVLDFFNRTLKGDKDNFYETEVSPYEEIRFSKN